MWQILFGMWPAWLSLIVLAGAAITLAKTGTSSFVKRNLALLYWTVVGLFMLGLAAIVYVVIKAPHSWLLIILDFIGLTVSLFCGAIICQQNPNAGGKRISLRYGTWTYSLFGWMLGEDQGVCDLAWRYPLLCLYGFLMIAVTLMAGIIGVIAILAYGREYRFRSFRWCLREINNIFELFTDGEHWFAKWIYRIPAKPDVKWLKIAKVPVSPLLLITMVWFAIYPGWLSYSCFLLAVLLVGMASGTWRDQEEDEISHEPLNVWKIFDEEHKAHVKEIPKQTDKPRNGLIGLLTDRFTRLKEGSCLIVTD